MRNLEWGRISTHSFPATVSAMKEQISKVSEFTYHIDVIIYLWSVPKLSRYQVMDM